MTILSQSIQFHPVPPGMTAFNPANIPLELKKVPQWVLWEPVWKDPTERVPEGKWSKVPKISSAPGRNASSTNPDTWDTFDAAVQAAIRAQGMYGIGFVLTSKDNFVGIDLDGCRDPETGKIDTWAQHILDQLDTYTEVSPSQTGLRVICTGEKPGRQSKAGKFEIYSESRFLTITGHRISGAHYVNNQTGPVANIYFEMFKREACPEIQREITSVNVHMDDFSLLDRIKNSKQGAKFLNLWAGNWQAEGHPSQSEADFALCNILWWWTGDISRVDRMFRSSGLYREKWERKDYHESIFLKIQAHPVKGERMPEPSKSDSVREVVGTTTNTKNLTLALGIPEGQGWTKDDYARAHEFIAAQEGKSHKKINRPLYSVNDQSELRERAQQYFPIIPGVYPLGTRLAVVKVDNPRHAAAHFFVSNSWVNEANAVCHRRKMYCHFWPMFRFHVENGGEIYRYEIPLEKVDIGKPVQKALSAANARVTRRRGLFEWFACPAWGVIVYYSSVDTGEGERLESLGDIEGDLILTLQNADLPDLERCGGWSFGKVHGGSREWGFPHVSNNQWRAIGMRQEAISSEQEYDLQEELDRQTADQMKIVMRAASAEEVASRSPGVITETHHLEVAETVGAAKMAKNPDLGGYLVFLAYFKACGYKLTEAAFNDYLGRTMSALKRKEDSEVAKEPLKAVVGGRQL